MNVKVEVRKEGGWTVAMHEGAFSTMRYVLPSSDRFIVVNPFRIESHFAEVSDFDTAVSVAVASGENTKYKM